MVYAVTGSGFDDFSLQNDRLINVCNLAQVIRASRQQVGELIETA